MKRLALIALALAALTLAGCVGTTALGILDESVPEESRCPLEIRGLSVVVYDNKPVEWVPTFTSNKVTITLPPGEHTFMTRHFESQTSGNYTTTYVVTNTLKQEFLPGHSYRIYRQVIWLIFFTIANVKIKDVTPKSKL
jgi:hypothetical protein